MSAVIPSLRGALRSFDLDGWWNAGEGCFLYAAPRDQSGPGRVLTLHATDLVKLRSSLLENGPVARYLLGAP